MDYQSIYDQLVAKYKDHPKVKFQTNDHHIIPQCFAKVDNIEDIDGRWNRVHLPHRAHFIAHLLLARIWRHHKIKGPKMANAFNRMSNCGWYTSKDYTWLKLNYEMAEETRMKISNANTGKKHTEETKRKIAEGNKEKIVSEETKMKMRKPRSEKAKINMKKSEETKMKMRKPKSDEHREKISKCQIGRKHSEESKKKMSEAKKGKKQSEESNIKRRETLTGRKRGPYKKKI